VEKFDTQKGSWIPCGRSPETGSIRLNIKILNNFGFHNKLFIALTVTSLTPGKEYKFRVTAVNAEGESEPLQTEESIVAKNPFGNTVIQL